METAIGSGYLKLGYGTVLQGLVEGDDDLLTHHLTAQRTGRELYFLAIDEAVHTLGGTLGYFLLAQGMDINGLAKVDGYGEFGTGIAKGDLTLGFTQTCPPAIDGLGLWGEGLRITGLLAPVMIG